MSDERLFVLSLDGVPHSFVERGIATGDMPCLGELAGRFGLRKIRSELPTISSVAWTSFVTGTNPAAHGIFGFVDRVPESGELFIPTARNRRADPIWKRLSDRGRPAISINVPGAYPPDDIYGCVVSGFLCPGLDRATARSDVARKLAQMQYVVDVDVERGRSEEKTAFLAALHAAVAKRRELALWFLENESWDYFQLHIMETDRINHFLWDAQDNSDHQLHGAFRDFYRHVDALVGEIVARVADHARPIILSDHGFCRARVEVNVNALLREKGFLNYRIADAMNLDAIEPSSRAFSLLPGRVYVNLAGRERCGCVAREIHESLLTELAQALAETREPEAGKPVFAAVRQTRDIYSGPLLPQACDLIAVPCDGFDLRAGFRTNEPFRAASMIGIHTYDDAFVIADGVLRGDESDIRDVGRRVNEILLGVGQVGNLSCEREVKR